MWEGLTSVVEFWCCLLSGWGRSLLSRIFGVLNIEKLSDLVKCLFHIKMTMEFLFQMINLFSCTFSDIKQSLYSWDTRRLRFLSSYCFSVLLDSVCWFLFIYYNCVCVLWHIYGGQKTNNSAGLVLSLNFYTGSRDQTQVIKQILDFICFFSSLFIGMLTQFSFQVMSLAAMPAPGNELGEFPLLSWLVVA